MWASQLKQAYFCGSNDVLHMYFPCKNGLKILIFRGAAPLHPAVLGPLRGRLMLSNAEIASQLLNRIAESNRRVRIS